MVAASDALLEPDDGEYGAEFLEPNVSRRGASQDRSQRFATCSSGSPALVGTAPPRLPSGSRRYPQEGHAPARRTRRPAPSSEALATLTPIIWANSDCEFPSRCRIAFTSTARTRSRGWPASSPRRMRPASRTLSTNSSKAASSWKLLANQTAQYPYLLRGQIDLDRSCG